MPKDSLILSQHISLQLNSLSRAVFHISFPSHQNSISKAVLYTHVCVNLRGFILGLYDTTHV